MRYLPLSDADRRAMLQTIGVADVEDLFGDVPAAARPVDGFGLPDHASEMEVERRLARMAARNLSAGNAPCFLGAGAYRHHVPAAVDALIQRGEFLTSYTPYQPEVSQGTLQALFEFQTQVAMITAMEVANASMYDAATACAEAAAMACRLTRRRRVLLSGQLHPHYRSVTATQLQFTQAQVEAQPPDPHSGEDLIRRVDGETACVVVQNPGFFGQLIDYSDLGEACRAAGALLVVAVAEPVSLGLVMPPGAMGADIVVGEGQPIGNSLNFGGPGLGLFATRQKYVRQMPGRLCGQTADADGRRGFVLTLATREQHIRREKATSNICTNSGLCTLAFSIHMALLGESGFAHLAALNHVQAVTAADALARIPGVRVLPSAFFNEFAVKLPRPAAIVVEALARRGILAGVPASRFYPDHRELSPILLVACTETNSPEDVEALVGGLREVLR